MAWKIELALVIALGSAVGDPMFYADVPLLHGFIIIESIISRPQRIQG